jgi:hypothetical protein
MDLDAKLKKAEKAKVEDRQGVASPPSANPDKPVKTPIVQHGLGKSKDDLSILSRGSATVSKESFPKKAQEAEFYTGEQSEPQQKEDARAIFSKEVKDSQAQKLVREQQQPAEVERPASLPSIGELSPESQEPAIAGPVGEPPGTLQAPKGKEPVAAEPFVPLSNDSKIAIAEDLRTRVPNRVLQDSIPLQQAFKRSATESGAHLVNNALDILGNIAEGGWNRVRNRSKNEALLFAVNRARVHLALSETELQAHKGAKKIKAKEFASSIDLVIKALQGDVEKWPKLGATIWAKGKDQGALEGYLENSTEDIDELQARAHRVVELVAKACNENRSEQLQLDRLPPNLKDLVIDLVLKADLLEKNLIFDGKSVSDMLKEVNDQVQDRLEALRYNYTGAGFGEAEYQYGEAYEDMYAIDKKNFSNQSGLKKQYNRMEKYAEKVEVLFGLQWKEHRAPESIPDAWEPIPNDLRVLLDRFKNPTGSQ